MLNEVFDYAASTTGYWSSTLWNNYNTSLWYTDTYPFVGRSGFSSVEEESSGWLLGVYQGSSDMHSPVLYSPAPSHEAEYAAEGETAHEAWLRVARATIDHAIFSIDTMIKPDMNMTPITSVPEHIVPWIPRVGTAITQPGGPTIDNPESYVRDLMAMIKSKGINETIMWGDHNVETEAEWDANDNVTQQVWDYNLSQLKSRVYNTSTVTTSHHLDDTMKFAQFAEESTLNIESWDRSDAIPFPGWDDNDGSAIELEMTFDVDNSNLGDQYALVLEAVTGGGDWQGILNESMSTPFYYKLRIRNFSTSSWTKITNLTYSADELWSTSTRRAEYDLNQSNDLVVTFDNMTNVTDVRDRKDIIKWTFDVPSPCDYIHPTLGYMKLDLQIWHDQEGSTDDFQLDALTLYETSETSPQSDQTSCTGSPLLADFDGDETIDLVDIQIFLMNFSQQDDAPMNLDVNRDKQINYFDLQRMLEIITENK